MVCEEIWVVRAHGTVREVETSAQSQPDGGGAGGAGGFLLETKILTVVCASVGGYNGRCTCDEPWCSGVRRQT